PVAKDARTRHTALCGACAHSGRADAGRLSADGLHAGRDPETEMGQEAGRFAGLACTTLPCCLDGRAPAGPHEAAGKASGTEADARGYAGVAISGKRLPVFLPGLRNVIPQRL